MTAYEDSPLWFGIEKDWTSPDAPCATIVPAPYEGTVSYGKGASLGPRAILEASPYIELYDSVTEKDVYKFGIDALPALEMPSDPSQAARKVKRALGSVLESGSAPVLVGGEHSLTTGAVEACLEKYPDLSVLQIDAHADLRDAYEGSRHSHASVMRRIADLGVPFTQAAVRSMSREEREWLDDNGRDVVSSRRIRTEPEWAGEAAGPLTKSIYLTLDLDALDPSEMPATGCPEPGGISYHDIVDLVMFLKYTHKRVVAFDVMELAPVPGLHHPQYLAASLIYTMIGAFFT